MDFLFGLALLAAAGYLGYQTGRAEALRGFNSRSQPRRPRRHRYRR